MKTGDMIEGRYRIIKTLGAGGMGTVYLAEHVEIKRQVAIKILHADLASDSGVVERFMNEARAAGTLGHRNIVEAIDVGFHENVPYIVYEYLQGTLLTDEIYRVAGMPVRRVVRIADQIASALVAAHEANIVHRDLKSDNIFLTDRDGALDNVKVLDFGISKFLEGDEQTGSGQELGTPEYMAPEQITNPRSVDTRADIYSLGVIIYEMLTGRRPFNNDENPRQLKHRIVNDPPPPLQRTDVPHAFNVIIFDRMLAKEPRRRYQTMADVQFALDQFATGGATRHSARMSAQKMSFEEDGVPTCVHLPLPLAAPEKSKEFPAQPAPSVASTSVRDIASVGMSPRKMTPAAVPVTSRDTPWPGTHSTLDHTPIPMGQITLPNAAPTKRPYALYGVAAAGILMGMLGLVVGLRGSKSKDTETSASKPLAQPEQTAAQPLPAAATMPAPTAEKIEVKLGSDVPNAHVVFRRRVANAPVTMEINATDVVELVEVSAPGYKTTRYWLTFDRPTYLTAHLIKGTGLVEATEEDTLVALGEVIMVHDDAPAAAASGLASAEAKPVETAPEAVQAPIAPAPTTATMARRKIGRSAAGDTAQTETGVTPAASVTPAEKPAETKSVEAVAATETKPEPVKEEPKQEPVKEEPKQEPVKAVAAPTEVVAEPVVPMIDKATVTSVVSAHRPEVLKCFAEGKKKNPQMKGTLSLTLQVQPSGKVFHVQVTSTLSAPLVSACVVKAANGWKFPTRSGGEMANVAYPFTIN